MERVLFGRGARGRLVRKIQQRLNKLGFDPQGVDGVYGDKTTAAVVAFQQGNGFQPSGEIDVETWEALTGTAIPLVKDRALEVTAAFEGHDFNLAVGNFDGAGITWGIIGFTLKDGELSKIILEIFDQSPNLVEQAFAGKTEELIQIMKAPKAKQMAFANSISRGTNKVRLAEPWQSAFQRFGEFEEVQALQIKRAEQDYFRPAVHTASKLGLKTELGLALAFDIHVQNGGIKQSAREEIQENLAAHPVTHEQELRIIVANAVTDNAKVEFRDDVRSRKLTLATGTGKVHGATYLLRNWGLNESSAQI